MDVSPRNNTRRNIHNSRLYTRKVYTGGVFGRTPAGPAAAAAAAAKAARARELAQVKAAKASKLAQERAAAAAAAAEKARLKAAKLAADKAEQERVKAAKLADAKRKKEAADAAAAEKCTKSGKEFIAGKCLMKCPAGKKRSGTTCADDPSHNCPPGQKKDPNKGCVADPHSECPPGKHHNGVLCVEGTPPACTGNKVLVLGKCEAACKAPKVRFGTQCLAACKPHFHRVPPNTTCVINEADPCPNGNLPHKTKGCNYDPRTGSTIIPFPNVSGIANNFGPMLSGLLTAGIALSVLIPKFNEIKAAGEGLVKTVDDTWNKSSKVIGGGGWFPQNINDSINNAIKEGAIIELPPPENNSTTNVPTPENETLYNISNS